MVLDEPLSERIAEIVRPMMARWPASTRRRSARQPQAGAVPRGATVLDPVGTAPGSSCRPLTGRTGPTVVVLPGPPRELQPMWETPSKTEAFLARRSPVR